MDNETNMKLNSPLTPGHLTQLSMHYSKLTRFKLTSSKSREKSKNWNYKFFEDQIAILSFLRAQAANRSVKT